MQTGWTSDELQPCHLAGPSLKLSAQLKWNWNKTETKVKQKQFWNSFEAVLFRPKQNVLAGLANHFRYPLFARQTRAGGVERWRMHDVVTRYCNTLLFGVTTRVMRYILPEVTFSVTKITFCRNAYDIHVCWKSLIDSIIDSSFA